MKENKIKECAKRLDWQDREIKRLLGLLKQSKLHKAVKSTTSFDLDNWQMTDK